MCEFNLSTLVLNDTLFFGYVYDCRAVNHFNENPSLILLPHFTTYSTQIEKKERCTCVANRQVNHAEIKGNKPCAILLMQLSFETEGKNNENYKVNDVFVCRRVKAKL